MSKTDNKIKKFAEKKCPPLITKKDVLQCMYCHFYDDSGKECRLYGYQYAVKRNPNDYCSYATLKEKWLEKLNLTKDTINNEKEHQSQTDADILKELLK